MFALRKYSQQIGRSMVEMLGVLAIIGVLSVGGIAGYSQAMKKHNLNKLREQVILTFNNLIVIHNNNPNFELTNAVINALDVLPKEMGKAANCRHALGGKCTLIRGQSSKRVLLTLYDLSTADCTDVVNAFSGQGTGVTPCANPSNANTCGNTDFYGDNNRRQMTLDKIAKMCKGKKNAVLLYLDNLL